MTDVVRITGRRMSGDLQRAIDNLTGPRRRAAIAALQQSDGPIADLHHALALELGLADLREADALQRLGVRLGDVVDVGHAARRLIGG